MDGGDCWNDANQGVCVLQKFSNFRSKGSVLSSVLMSVWHVLHVAFVALGLSILDSASHFPFYTLSSSPLLFSVSVIEFSDRPLHLIGALFSDVHITCLACLELLSFKSSFPRLFISCRSSSILVESCRPPLSASGCDSFDGSPQGEVIRNAGIAPPQSIPAVVAVIEQH